MIVEYFRALEEARDLTTVLASRSAGTRKVCVHLGAGDHRLAGWINVDLAPSEAVDLLADLRGTMPFKPESIDFVHSEDLLEHLDLNAGKRLVAEVFRILRPGGVMRVLTPDLRRLVKRLYLGRSRLDLRWCAAYLDASTPCEALNMHLRMCGEHRFVYDRSCLREVLRGAGFRVQTTSFNRSRYPELRYLDLRNFKLNMFLEGRKPG